MTGKTYPWIVKTTGLVNQFYFYCVDADFGPFFLKFCSYFPYNAKLCLNGSHWAQRQAAKAGIGFTPLDNAFATVDDPTALQQVCDQLGPDQIDASASPGCASPTTASTRCSPRSSSSACSPTASPAATCASTSRPCSDATRAPSPADR
jgi:hypothetical protein